MIKFFEVGTDEMNGVRKILCHFKAAIELPNDCLDSDQYFINKLNNLSSALLYKDCADFIEAFNLLCLHIEGLESAVALYKGSKVLNFFEVNTEEYAKIRKLLRSIRFLADSFDQPDSADLNVVASVVFSLRLSCIEVVYLFRLLLQHISGLEYAVALHQESLDDDLDEVLSEIYSKVDSEDEADHLKADEEAAHAIKEFHLQHAFLERSDIHGKTSWRK